MRVVDYLPSFDDSSSGIAACLSHYRKSSGFSRGASIYRGVTRLVVLKYIYVPLCT